MPGMASTGEDVAVNKAFRIPPLWVLLPPLTTKCWRACYQSLPFFSFYPHTLPRQCHLLPRLSKPSICICQEVRLPFQTWLTSCLLILSMNHTLGPCKVDCWVFFLPAHTFPSPVFPNSIHGTKQPNRGVVLGSCIPQPVGSNSLEWELDPTAEYSKS